MKKFLTSCALASAALLTPLAFSSASAADMSMKSGAMMKSDKMMASAVTDQAFTSKKYAIKGSWSVVKENGQTIIRLSDDFKTKRGPDLKLFLSPMSIDVVSGATATAGSVSLGALKSNKGTSDYIVPAGVDLALYQSVLIHCEAYAVLWGGGAL